MTARTMAEKIWDEHAIGDDLLFIDLHLVHEVSSPQAFDGLRAAGRRVRRVDRTLATADHNVPTWELSRPSTDPISQAQLDALERNVAEFGVPYHGRGHVRQGIVHVIGPELGLMNPDVAGARECVASTLQLRGASGPACSHASHGPRDGGGCCHPRAAHGCPRAVSSAYAPRARSGTHRE